MARLPTNLSPLAGSVKTERFCQMRIANGLLWFGASLTAAFFSYGTGRTMVELVGPSRAGVLGGALVTIVLAGMVWAVLFLAFKLLSGSLNPRPALLACGLIMGGLAAETAVLNDELAFLQEVEQESRRAGRATFSRPRAWPHSSGSLLWSAERGVWATD